MYGELIGAFPDLEFVFDYPLGKKTSFKVGGNADVAVFPKTVGELKSLISFLKGRFRYIVLGACTNVLVSDRGFGGVVVFTERIKTIELFGSILRVGCGAKIGDVLKVCRDNTLSGLEFACGIPGTIGGMVTMNAGCFNKSVGDYVIYVIAENGVYNNLNCSFDYRSSRFSRGETVFEVGFRLKISEQENIESKIERFSSVRKKSQPKGNSCGSCFLNEGFFAGKIIDQAGLKGLRSGGARVSDKHANFIVSDGGTAQDVRDLIETIKKRVYDFSGTVLHEELKYVGEFDET